MINLNADLLQALSSLQDCMLDSRSLGPRGVIRVQKRENVLPNIPQSLISSYQQTHLIDLFHVKRGKRDVRRNLIAEPIKFRVSSWKPRLTSL